MPDPDPILQAIDACFADSPSPPTGGDLAAAVLRAAVEQIELLPAGADCADHLEALAARLDGRMIRSATFSSPRILPGHTP